MLAAALGCGLRRRRRRRLAGAERRRRRGGWFASSAVGGVAALRVPRLVRRPRPRPDAARAPRPRRLRAGLQAPRRARTSSCSPTATRTRTPTRSARRWSLPPHPVRLELDDDGRRSRLTVFFRLLLALPHLVWLALWIDRGVPRRDRELVRRAVPRPLGRAAAPVPRRLRPLLRPTCRLPLPGRPNPFPGFAGAPGYPVDIAIDAARAAEPLDDAVPRASSRCRRSSSRAHSAASLFVVGLPRLVRRARDRPDADRAPQPRRVRRSATARRRTRTGSSSPTAIRTRARRCRPPPEPEPEYEPEPAAARAGGDLTSRARRCGVVAARARRLVGRRRLVALAERRPGRPRPADRSTLAAIFGAESLDARRPLRALLPRRVRRLAQLVAARRARRCTRSTGIRFARESAAGRIGTGMLLGMIGLGARLDLAGAVPPGRGLVGPPLRPDRQRLRRDALRELVRARRRVPVHLLRARHRDGARGAVPAPLVARRRAGLRRARGALRRSSTRTSRRPSRCDEPACWRAGRDYASEQGIEPIPLRVEDVTDFTNAPNAYAVGFGPSKRIVFWNTMLDGRFTRRRGEGRARARARAPLAATTPRGPRLVRALRASRRLADRRGDPAARWHGRTRRRCRSRCS